MIVTCERCQTRFKLDAARLPDTGARVRCSRCKHAFFVARPGEAGRDALVHGLAGEAARGGTPAAPEATADLRTLHAGAPLPGNTSATRLMPELAEDAAWREAKPADPARGDDESDWQFNEPVRHDEGATQGRVSRRPPPRRPRPPSDEGVALDALGSPESWDILGDAELPPLESVIPTAAARGPEPSARGAEPAREAVAPGARGASAGDRPATPVASERRSLREAPREILFFGAVWLWLAAVTALCLWPATPGASSPAVSATLGSVAFEDLRGRFVDNAVGGLVFVVTGVAHAAGGSAGPQRFEVVLLGPDGSPLAASRGVVGEAPEIARIREAPPETLAQGIEASDLARGVRPIAEGERVSVAAIVRDAPRDVTGFRLEAAGRSDTGAH
ncbi:MAG TPA: zinc-ribbon domain-containing protein [Myxococcota bacterium]|nr:zinc-ribbon domain-containing protein [Myxococcota bacterium]